MKKNMATACCHYLKTSAATASRRKSLANLKFLSTSCRHAADDDVYKDVTKQNTLFTNMQDLRAQMQHHVGGKKDWLKEAKTGNVRVIQCQEELESRCLQDSIQEVVLAFKSEGGALEDYRNFYGGIRVGKLLQDLDTLSGWVGFKYYKDAEQRPPFSLVTACVDSIDFSASLDPHQDLKMKGFVSWVGKTSLETTISIEQQVESGEWIKKAESIFIMAARSLSDGRSAVLNKMVPQTEEEKWYYERGEQNKLLRRTEISESLFSTAPAAEEWQIIHDKFLQTVNLERATFQSRTKPSNSVWMEDTRLKNLVVCQPDKRNIYNKIFGGYLMREAMELAWANACIYMKCNPHIRSVEDIAFRKPVEIGSLLYMSSIVVYTSERHAQIRVVAEVYNVKTETFEATNTFYFLFSANKIIPQIVPKSYGEYILYLDGRRQCRENLRID